MKDDIREIVQHFQISGNFLFGQPYGNGHINDTYLAGFDQSGTEVHYIVQRINDKVFKDPVSLMGNVYRVTSHQGMKLGEAGLADCSRHALSLIPAEDSLPYYIDTAGNTWRIYPFIENTVSYDFAETPAAVYEAAKAFGAFQQQLTDLPEPRLHETISDFHNTPKRFVNLEKAVESDVVNRALFVKDEIEFALKNKDTTGLLIEKHKEGLIPERTTHNDTKLNNVLLDVETGEGVCVIDLDTVMAGLSLYDFGDLIRSGTCMASEDTKDTSKVVVSLPMYEAILKGYLESTREILTETEKEFLAFSGELMTFEVGIRFLTDYLSGDTYFKTDHEHQNLDRCRVQFQLLRSIRENEKSIRRLMANLL